jgi:predicted nucleotidyltransferase
MIPDTIRTEILHRIRTAEAEHGVRVLLAIESASRAWGFESPDSDYDARFIYAHPKDRYLSIGLEEQRDVIEYKIADDIDLKGWDVRKALRLFWKSNSGFVEWIQSPIIYLEVGGFAGRVRNLLPSSYSCESGIYHYRSMAKSIFHTYLKTELVSLKKYFYALRPLLAVRWIERYGTAAPVEFHKLLHLIDDNPALINDIHSLLERKRRTSELGVEPPVQSINSFIERELERLDHIVPPTHQRDEVLSQLNEVFHLTLGEA